MNDAVRLSGWLRLALTPGIGGETQRKLLAAFGPPEGIFGADFASVVSVIGEKPARTLLATNQQPRIEAALAWAAVEGRRILTLGDSEYPSALLEIADPPTVIYVLGEISLLQRPAIAVVATPPPKASATRSYSLPHFPSLAWSWPADWRLVSTQLHTAPRSPPAVKPWPSSVPALTAFTPRATTIWQWRSPGAAASFRNSPSEPLLSQVISRDAIV